MPRTIANEGPQRARAPRLLEREAGLAVIVVSVYGRRCIKVVLRELAARDFLDVDLMATTQDPTCFFLSNRPWHVEPSVETSILRLPLTLPAAVWPWSFQMWARKEARSQWP